MSITIYMHRNKINGKVYIGQTSQSLSKRFGNNGNGYKTSSKFYKAIQKYGWDNFDHIILYDNLTPEEADTLEKQLIQYYHATDDQFGYNLQSGGTEHHFQSEETKIKIGNANKISQKGKKWSDQQHQKMAGRFTGKNNPFYGKHHSEQSRKLISEHRKGIATFTGKHHTEITKQQISEHRKGQGGKPVICLETNEIFNCMMDAARWCGLKTACSIGQCCMGKVKSAGKHPITKEPLHWKYIKDNN